MPPYSTGDERRTHEITITNPPQIRRRARWRKVMKIISDEMTIQDIRKLAVNTFGDMVKGVVDIDREIIALDAELHSDLEAYLLEEGSRQGSLWGVNFYPDLSGDEFVEFDSLINIRPSQGNRGRVVEDESIRRRILEIVSKRIVQ